MNQRTGETEVKFDKWCSQCKYENESEFDEDAPCYDCMFEYTNQYSTKPTKFKTKDAKISNSIMREKNR